VQNYNVTSVRASPITVIRRNWGVNHSKPQMNLILLCYGWFISENSGFMGEFSSFMALTVGNYSAPPMGMSNRLTVVLQQELHW